MLFQKAQRQKRVKEVRPPRIIALLARAKDFEGRLSSGEIASRADLARRFGLTRARVTQILNLLKLHSRVVSYLENLGAGTPFRFVTERKLRALTALPVERQVEWAAEHLPGWRPSGTQRASTTSQLQF